VELNDYNFFAREKLEKDIQNKMLCQACVEHCFEVSNGMTENVDVNNFCFKILQKQCICIAVDCQVQKWTPLVHHQTTKKTMQEGVGVRNW